MDGAVPSEQRNGQCLSRRVWTGADGSKKAAELRMGIDQSPDEVVVGSPPVRLHQFGPGATCGEKLVCVIDMEVCRSWGRWKSRRRTLEPADADGLLQHVHRVVDVLLPIVSNSLPFRLIERSVGICVAVDVASPVDERAPDLLKRGPLEESDHCHFDVREILESWNP